MIAPHPDDVLRDELVLLRAAIAAELRKQIEKGDSSPALLEAARKFVGDQLIAVRPPKAPPVSRDLPYPAP